MLKTLLGFLLLLSIVAPASAEDALQSAARKIADQISNPPAQLPEMYSPVFLRAVPEAQLAGIFKSLNANFGPVVQVSLSSQNSPMNGKFMLEYKDVEQTVDLDLEAAEPHLVDGLWFGPASPRLQTLDEVTARLAALPGKVSFQLQCLDTGDVIQAHNAEMPLAIGSAFKLYVLETLIRQKIAWDKVVTLQDRYKSLPSGEMRNWPTGSPVTIHTLAVQMISHSDNTAADHLLRVAGRENVEANLPELGMKNPAANVPFLSTREMFQIKADPALCQEYLAADATGREAILERIAGAPPPDLAKFPSAAPVAIDQVEWFASAADLCRLLGIYDKEQNATALAILAINPGLEFPADKFTYIGFKGGSESGVLNMTWLLHTRSGHHYVLSASWNNPAQKVDIDQFSGLMVAAARLIEAPAPQPPPAGGR
jgi:hypothetical protein